MKNAFLYLAVAIVAAVVVAVAGPAVAAGAGYNSAGNQVYASAQVADSSGVTTTVATAGTYVTVATAAPLAAAEDDGSGAITYTLASNKFTVATRSGVGELLLTACLNDVIGTNAKTWTGAWHRVRSGSTTQVGPILRHTEPATADRGSEGCVQVIVDAQLSDTYDFRFDSGTNGDTVVTRHASFSARKLLSK